MAATRQTKDNELWYSARRGTKETLERAFKNYVNGPINRQIKEFRRALNLLNGDTIAVDLGNAEQHIIYSTLYNTLTGISAHFRLSNSFTGNSIPVDQPVLLKHYRDRTLNGNKIRNSRRAGFRELYVLRRISELSDRVPRFYYYEDQTIYMEGIEGLSFQEFFDNISRPAKEVLRYITVRYLDESKPVLEQEVKEHFKEMYKSHIVDEELFDLKQKKLIKITQPREFTSSMFSDSIQKDDLAIVPDTTLVLNRFDAKGQSSLVEKDDFTKYKDYIIRTVIKNLLKLQKAANSIKEELQEFLPSQDLQRYIARDKYDIENLALANIQKDTKLSSIFSPSEIKTLEDILTDINQPFIPKTTEECISLVQFTQGDAYPANIMVSGNRVIIFDFNRSNFSFFLNDVIDFLSYLEIFSKPINSAIYYQYAFERKLSDKYMDATQLEIQNKYRQILKEANTDILKLARQKRILSTVGRLSEAVLKSRYIDPQLSKRFESRRRRYIKYLFALLETTQPGSRLKELFISKGDIFNGHLVSD